MAAKVVTSVYIIKKHYLSKIDKIYHTDQHLFIKLDGEEKYYLFCIFIYIKTCKNKR